MFFIILFTFGHIFILLGILAFFFAFVLDEPYQAYKKLYQVHDDDNPAMEHYKCKPKLEVLKSIEFLLIDFAELIPTFFK